MILLEYNYFLENKKFSRIQNFDEKNKLESIKILKVYNQ